jgi:hypothetical protein
MKKGISLTVVALALVIGGCGKKTESEKKNADTTLTHPGGGNPTTTIMFNSKATDPIQMTTGANSTVIFFSSYAPAGTMPSDSIFSFKDGTFKDSAFVTVVTSGNIYTIPGSATPGYYRMYIYYNAPSMAPSTPYNNSSYYLEPVYKSLIDAAFFGNGGYSLALVSDTYTMQIPKMASQNK